MFYARHEATNPNMRAPSERAFALCACASSSALAPMHGLVLPPCNILCA